MEKQEQEIKKKEDMKAVKSSDEFPYIVELYDIWGTTSKRTLRIPAKRFIEDGNVFLYNEKLNFKVEFPEDNEEYKKYKMKEIEALLLTKETNLKKLKKAKEYDISKRKDYEEDIRILNGWKKSLELQGRGSYMIFDDDKTGGKPLFMFDRKGNFKLPVFKNVDISLMHIPNEANITEASDLLKENYIKNGSNDQVKLFNIIITVLLVCLICFFGWISYKATGQVTEVSDVLAQAVNGFNDIADKFGSATDKLTNMTIEMTNNSNIINKPIPNLKEVK